MMEEVQTVMSSASEVFSKSLMSLTLTKATDAALIAVIGLVWYVATLKTFDRLTKKINLDPTLKGLIRTTLRIVLLLAIVLMVAQMLDIPITSFVAILSVLGLAVSLAVQGLLANVAGGITILVTKPFTAGDYVEIGDQGGTVVALGMAYTQLRTPGNQIIYVPNQELTAGRIVNYSKEPTRRLDTRIFMAWGVPMEDVRSVLLDSAAQTEGCLNDPAPACMVEDISDARVGYLLRVYTKTEQYWTVKFALQAQIKSQMEKRSLLSAPAHMHVHLKNDQSEQ